MCSSFDHREGDADGVVVSKSRSGKLASRLGVGLENSVESSADTWSLAGRGCDKPISSEIVGGDDSALNSRDDSKGESKQSELLDVSWRNDSRRGEATGDAWWERFDRAEKSSAPAMVSAGKQNLQLLAYVMVADGDGGDGTHGRG